MAKEVKQHKQKSIRKTILKDIEGKLADTLKDYHKKVSDKKFRKKIRKAGKILSDSLTTKNITIVPKKQDEQKKAKRDSAGGLDS